MGIIQRYLVVELVRMFALVVISLTLMLVVFGVVAEATKNGLGPAQILEILPYIIPSLLPFTIPATLLLTVCVVYGRMAGAQEITALKGAGINVMTVLWPSFALAAVLSLSTFILTDQFIPWARAKIERVVTLAMEDIFLDILRTKNQFSDTSRGISIAVARVEERRLISPVFRYTLQGGRTVTITAREAMLSFDVAQQQVMLKLDDAYVETPDGATLIFAHQEYPFPLPLKLEAPKARNITIEGIRRELTKITAERAEMENRQIIATAFALSHGDFAKLDPRNLASYEAKRADGVERYNRLNTETHSRVALACSCFFFALVGSPFAVLQARRQFLTIFFYCFVPIVLLYYPIVLVMTNLGKDDKINPAVGMWLGNLGLLVAAMLILRRVLRH
jgi:lipopolysaccharide export system permease protein